MTHAKPTRKSLVYIEADVFLPGRSVTCRRAQLRGRGAADAERQGGAGGGGAELPGRVRGGARRRRRGVGGASRREAAAR